MGKISRLLLILTKINGQLILIGGLVFFYLIKLLLIVLFLYFHFSQHQFQFNWTPVPGAELSIEGAGEWQYKSKLYHLNYITIANAGKKLLKLDHITIFQDTSCNYLSLTIEHAMADYSAIIALWDTLNSGQEKATAAEFQFPQWKRLALGRIRIKELQIERWKNKPVTLALLAFVECSSDSIHADLTVDGLHLEKLPATAFNAQLSFIQLDPHTLVWRLAAGDVHSLSLKTEGVFNFSNYLGKGQFTLNEGQLARWLPDSIKKSFPPWIEIDSGLIKSEFLIDRQNIILENGFLSVGNVDNTLVNTHWHRIEYLPSAATVRFDSLLIAWNKNECQLTRGSIDLNNFLFNGEINYSLRLLPEGQYGISRISGTGSIIANDLNWMTVSCKKVNWSQKLLGEWRGININWNNELNFTIERKNLQTSDWVGSINGCNYNGEALLNLTDTTFKIQLDCSIDQFLETIEKKRVEVENAQMEISYERNKDKQTPLFSIDGFIKKCAIDSLSFDSIWVIADTVDTENLTQGRALFSVTRVLWKNEIIFPRAHALVRIENPRHIIFNPIIVALPYDIVSEWNGSLALNQIPYQLQLDSSFLFIRNSRLRVDAPYITTIEPGGWIDAPEIGIKRENEQILIQASYHLTRGEGHLQMVGENFTIDSLREFFLPTGKWSDFNANCNFAATMSIDSAGSFSGSASISLTRIQLDQIEFDTLSLALNWLNHNMELMDIRLSSFEHSWQGRGWIDTRLNGRDMEIKLTGGGDIPYFIAAYLPQLYLLTGHYQGELSIDGSLQQPLIAGRLHLDSTDLFFNFLETPLQNIHAALRFNLDTIWVDSLSGKTVEQKKANQWNPWRWFFPLKSVARNFSLKGWLSPQDSLYNLDFTGRNLYFAYLPIKSDVMMDADLHVTHLRHLPYLTGSIRIHEFNLTDEFGNKSLPPEDSTRFFYNLILQMPGNIWVKNTLMNVETGGEIRIWLERPAPFPEVYGSLNAKRGQIFLYGYTFIITKGELFFSKGEVIDPALDVDAYTSLRNLTIQLHLGGTLTKPEFLFTSSPTTLSQEEIFAFFFSGSVDGRKSGSLNQEAGQAITGMLARQLSLRARNYLGLDQLEFNSTDPTVSSGAESMVERLKFSNLTIGKYITPQLYISYSGQMGLVGQTAISLEYLINNNLSLIGQKKTDGYYKMGIRLRFEY